jgi:hypothetical protein
MKRVPAGIDHGSSILWFGPSGASFRPAAHCGGRRAQWLSRMGAQRPPEGLVLDGREHGGTLAATGQSVGNALFHPDAPYALGLAAETPPEVLLEKEEQGVQARTRWPLT